MINFFVCDDAPLLLDLMKDLLQAYCKEKKIKADIFTFTSGIELLKEISNNHFPDICILDICMPDMDGMMVAKKIRDALCDCDIIFLSASPDYVFDSFNVHACQYLVKPVRVDLLYDTLDFVVGKKKNKGSYLPIRTQNSNEIRINKDDIIYVEHIDRHLYVHMSDGNVIKSVTIRGSVKDELSMLLNDKRFVMAGASLAINLVKIVRFEKEYIVFEEGSELFLPVRSYGKIHDNWSCL